MSAAAFAALAEPHRQAILRLVRDGPLSVNDIADHFAITQQAVSQHLKVLRDAGLVAVQPAGQRRLYALRPEGIASARELLDDFWPEHLKQLKDVVERDHGA